VLKLIKNYEGFKILVPQLNGVISGVSYVLEKGFVWMKI
jgi:hypothetical protein